jgi:hypothetical protein
MTTTKRQPPADRPAHKGYPNTRHRADDLDTVSQRAQIARYRFLTGQNPVVVFRPGSTRP